MHHIPIEQRVTAIALSLALVLTIIQLIRKGKLREEYALAWLAAGLVIFTLSVFGQIVSFFAALFAVTYAPTLMLVLGLFFALVISLSQSVVISTQANRLRDLAQNVTLLEWRLRRLEARQSSEFVLTDEAQPDQIEAADNREQLIEKIG